MIVYVAFSPRMNAQEQHEKNKKYIKEKKMSARYVRNGMFLYFYDVVFRADRANAVEGTHQKINSVSG